VLTARVIEHRQMRGVCTCGASHVGQFPEGINAPVQYGAAVKALAVHLNQYHLLPLQRACQVMQDAFGVSVSEASVQSFSQQAAAALSPTVAAIGRAVQSANIVHADESGIRIAGQLHWLHCAVTPTLSWLAWHPKRGRLAFEALGVLPGVRGTLVHDGLLGYKNLDCLHSLCNTHHLRELVFVHEHCDQKIWDGWAQEMMHLLIQAKGEVAQAAQAGKLLSPQRQAWYEAQWEGLLRRGEQINPEAQRADAPTGKRGKLGQSTAFNLLKRLRTYRRDVWRFITDRDVPFTNNLAEQALRMSKVKQKISGGFRTAHGASTFFTIRSYLATMHKQKANILDCLVSTFNGQPTQPCLAG
jgi:transposase